MTGASVRTLAACLVLAIETALTDLLGRAALRWRGVGDLRVVVTVVVTVTCRSGECRTC